MLRRRIATVVGGSSITIGILLVALTLVALPSKLIAFQISSNFRGRRSLRSYYQTSPAPTLSSLLPINNKSSTLLFAQGQDDDNDNDGGSREAEESPATPFSDSDERDKQDDNDSEDDPSKTIFSYKSGLSQSRTTSELRPGSTRARPIDVTMKFGGSSLANAECIDRVTKLIRDRIRPPPTKEDGTPNDEVPVRPRAGKRGAFLLHPVHNTRILSSMPISHLHSSLPCIPRTHQLSAPLWAGPPTHSSLQEKQPSRAVSTLKLCAHYISVHARNSICLTTHGMRLNGLLMNAKTC